MGCLAPSPVVHAEGLVWPLETFIDSHGFEPRPDIVECHDRYRGEVEIVDDHLQVRRVFEARHVDWHSVVAVKAGTMVCSGCNLSFDPDVEPIYATWLAYNDAGQLLRDRCYVFVVNSYAAEYCDSCRDDGDWDY